MRYRETSEIGLPSYHSLEEGDLLQEPSYVVSSQRFVAWSSIKAVPSYRAGGGATAPPRETGFRV